MKPFWPVDMQWAIFQKFGDNPQNYPKRKGHPGVDFDCPTGSPIYAVHNGKITLSEYRSSGGYGREINLVVNDRWKVVYGHESELLMRAGDVVTRGQLIGLSGGDPSDKYCGNSKSPHLHLEVRDLTQPQIYPLIGAVDPEVWLATDIENESQNLNSVENQENIPLSTVSPVLSLPSASQGIVEVADGEWCYLRTAHNTNNDPVCKVYPGKSFATTGQEFSEGGHDWVEVKCYMAKEYLK